MFFKKKKTFFLHFKINFNKVEVCTYLKKHTRMPKYTLNITLENMQRNTSMTKHIEISFAFFNITI